MSREEHAADVANELEILLLEEGPRGSKSLTILSKIQHALAEKLSTTEHFDYTRSRAIALRSLAMKMKALLTSSLGANMTYADKATALLVVSDGYLKLAHAFKTDPKMWSTAQSDLVPILTSVCDEQGIDRALDKVNSHLDAYLVSLDFWLRK